MAHVRYINILTCLRGFRVKIGIFSVSVVSQFLKEDLDTKKTTPNVEVCPESLGKTWPILHVQGSVFTVS